MKLRVILPLALLPALAIAASLASLVSTGAARGEERFITVASTTSTQNSGLFEAILPAFQEASGIAVRVVAMGTGQAITLAGNCDADVLFVHHKPSEESFVAEGKGLRRHDVMYNDFVIVGPAADPAGIAGSADAAAALAKIAATQAPFASRGDDSGTHKKELDLWKAAGLDPEAAEGSWYRATGSGMGATLNIASAMGAYALTDRATWISFANKGDLAVLAEGDPRLFNQYGIVLVNPEACPTTKAAEGQAFVDWATSPAGQAAIADFELEGVQLFFPNAAGGGS